MNSVVSAFFGWLSKCYVLLVLCSNSEQLELQFANLQICTSMCRRMCNQLSSKIWRESSSGLEHRWLSTVIALLFLCRLQGWREDPSCSCSCHLGSVNARWQSFWYSQLTYSVDWFFVQGLTPRKMTEFAGRRQLCTCKHLTVLILDLMRCHYFVLPWTFLMVSRRHLFNVQN